MMAHLNRQDLEELRELRRLVTLTRAGLTPPARAAERGYSRGPLEPSRRPLAEQSQVYPETSDAWTNDVAESLRIYTDSWILPIVDRLILKAQGVEACHCGGTRPLDAAGRRAHWHSEEHVRATRPAREEAS